MFTASSGSRRPAAAVVAALALVASISSSAPAALAAAQGDGLQVVQVTRFGGAMFDGMMGGLIRKAGMPEEMEETVTVNAEATKKRTDQKDKSSIVDLDGEQVIELDHKKKRASVIPFAVLRERMRKATEAMANLQQSRTGGGGQQDDAETPDVQVTLEASVESGGPVQHGQFAAEELRQTLAFHSRTAEGQDLGTFVTYSILHVTDAFDRGPLDAFDRAYAMKMSEILGETGGLGVAMAAVLGDERIREALAEASKGFEQIGDRAIVFTRMAMVSVPPDMPFDPEKAFVKPEKKGGGLGGMFKAATGGGGNDQQPAEQSTSIITEIDVRSAEWIALAADTFGIPARYKVEVERE